ncbi:hypothetical protein CUN67_09540 [Pantoea cypripedii]|uniref:Uncharacterized protein n=2 Tax=Pantoea cypripedii TaxID=55209 RepID=A0A6B9G4G3_PANCY|nr:hypothetical protein CUN67_09540 [Pantoea cypripedii]
MDVSRIAEGIWDSVKGMPKNFYYGVKRTYISTGVVGFDRMIRNGQENERFYQVIKSLVRNEEPLRRLITIVITEFYHKLDERGRQAVHNQIGYGTGRLAGRVGAQILTAQVVSASIVNFARGGVAWKTLYRFGTSFTISAGLWQGLIEEAALASRRMKTHYPHIYWKVQPQGLDMIYFIVEDHLKPYLDFISSHPEVCKRINNEICKLAG